MGYSSVTITIKKADDIFWEPYLNPSDVVSVGLNTNATVVIYNETGEQLNNEYDFYILDKAYPNHTENFGSYAATFGVPFSLSDAFGGGSQAGRYLWYGFGSYLEKASIPLVESYTVCTWNSDSKFYCSPTLTDSTTTLTWNGAKAGTSNSIASYEIQYSKSSNGSSWGSWTALTTVTSTATSGTKAITVSSYAGYGEYLKFRIRIRGSAGSSYYSGWKESSDPGKTVRRKWAPFGSYTDATLTAKSTKIRAVHLTELQERVNVIRPYYGLGAYSFTTVTAGVTKISKWATLVQEIRTAIDGITTNHDAWNTLEAGKPRIAHITQLRDIINKL